MTTYRVVWEIDIDADTPKEAAEEALRIQRDPESIAIFFKVATRNEFFADEIVLGPFQEIDLFGE